MLPMPPLAVSPAPAAAAWFAVPRLLAGPQKEALLKNSVGVALALLAAPPDSERLPPHGADTAGPAAGVLPLLEPAASGGCSKPISHSTPGTRAGGRWKLWGGCAFGGEAGQGRQ